jgi:hypothetical protein
VTLAGEAMLLEDVISSFSESSSSSSSSASYSKGKSTTKSNRKRLSLEVATLDDVLAWNKKRPGIEHGVLPKLFPLTLLAESSAAARAPASTMEAFATQYAASIAGAQQAAAESRTMARVRCDATMHAVSVRAPQEAYAIDALKDIGGELLYELFVALQATPELPCIKYQDAASAATFKLHASAIGGSDKNTEDRGVIAVPAVRLRAWTAPSPPTTRRQRPFVQLHVAIPAGHGDPAGAAGPSIPRDRQYASLILRDDLSITAYCAGFSRQSQQRRDVAAVERVLGAIDAIAGGRLKQQLVRADVPYRVPSALAAFRTTDSPAAITNLSYSLSLSGGDRTPTPAQLIAAISSRMTAFFSVVATKAGGVIVLAYRRASGASRIERAELAARLMWARPRDDVVRELVSTFGMSAEHAAAMQAAVTARPTGDDDESLVAAKRTSFGVISHRMETVPIVELRPAGRLGYEATAINVARTKYLGRISWLLRLLIAEAAPPDASPLWRRLPTFFAVPVSSSRPSLRGQVTRQGRSDIDSNSNSNSNSSAVDDVPSADEPVQTDDELDALIAEELNQEQQAVRGEAMGENAASASDATVVASDATVDANENAINAVGEDEDADLPHMYLLNQLHRADRDLFKYRGSRYATDCGHNNMRQPVVVSRDELARIDTEFPGSHSGAIVDFGSSAATREKNAYICPKVWCPRSRVALNEAQFKKLGGKCPFPAVDEKPLVFDTAYMPLSRERYPGFLDGRKHPAGFCMPCCFLKPAQRISKCGAKGQPAGAAATSPNANATGTKKERDRRSGTKEDDAVRSPGDVKYIRGDVAPLEPTRYGVLPQPIAEALAGGRSGGNNRGNNSRCGNRDDGSGQIVVNSRCFVRLGVDVGSEELHRQRFLACAVVALDNPAIRDVAALVSTIRSNLSAADFVTLDGGRVARRFVDGLDPIELLASDAAISDLRAWLGSDRVYVERFGLQHVVAAAKAAKPGSVRWPPSSKEGTGAADIDAALMREALVRGALLRYFERLDDASDVKTHAGAFGLLDLMSRPLAWLNPHRCNFMLLERAEPAGAPSQNDEDSLRVVVACPPDRVDPNAAWRLADPVVLIIRQGVYYEPIVQVALKRHGIAEERRFHPESNARLAAAVRTFLNVCARDGANPQRMQGVARLAAAASELAVQGRPAKAQVVDAFFGAIGLISADDLFVPLMIPPSTVLVGDVGSRLGLVYVGDMARMLDPKLSAAAAEAALKAVGVATGTAALSNEIERVQDPRTHATVALLVGTNSRTVVPLHGFASSAFARSPAFLEQLGVAVDVRPQMDARLELSQRRSAAARDSWTLRSGVVRKIRSDPELTAELRALRSSLHPLPPPQRRRLVSELIERVLSSSAPNKTHQNTLDALADALLYEPNQLSLRRDVGKLDQGAAASNDVVILTDYDIASGVLELSISASTTPVPGAGSSLDSQKLGQSSSSALTTGRDLIPPEGAKINKNKAVWTQQQRHDPRVDHTMPLDETTLARFVSVHGDANELSLRLNGDASNSKASHRSSSYKARHVAFVPGVDVYVAMHLAHRTLHSDAPMPLRDAIRLVQNELLARPPPAKNTDGTLGRMLQKKGGGAKRQDLLDAIARRGSSYVTSGYEIDLLSRFLGVHVVQIDELRPEDLASSKRLQEASSKRLADIRMDMNMEKHVGKMASVETSWYVVLRKRTDGKGHDLALSPSLSEAATMPVSRAVPPGAGAGHRLLFAYRAVNTRGRLADA